MYTFTPMTDEDFNALNLMEDGIYDFEVVRSTKRISKQGNLMAELNINVWDKQGKQHLIFDYLVFSTIPLNIKKVKHFCDATGLIEEYKKGEIPEDLERLSGKVHIGIREPKPNPSGGFYPKTNTVIDYVANKENKSTVPTTDNEIVDDEIPF